MSDWTAISTGGQFSQALRADGSRRVWGWNGGQFGDGGAERSLVPRRMPDAGPWTFLATGVNHTLGIDGQGWLWGWGLNFSAQLGDGTQVDRPAPMRIGGDAVWAVASPGTETSHAIQADGTLWGWGANQSGQVGDGRADVAMRLAPVRVGADTDWVAAASGTVASLGLKRDGTLWSWGRDGCGGGRSDQIMWVPTRVGAEADWQAIAAGPFHCTALRADGTLWAWGMNPSGQLGTTRYVPSPAPQRIGSRSDWVAVAAGLGCTFAVGRGGDLWAWGLGCLGWPNQLEAPIYEAGVEVVAPGD